MRAILAVFAKELRENLRERRTLLTALIFGPLFARLDLSITGAADPQRRGCGRNSHWPSP